MHRKVDLEIEIEGGGFNLPMIQNSKQIPSGVTTFVSWKYTHPMDKSWFPRWNGLDLEQNTDTEC